MRQVTARDGDGLEFVVRLFFASPVIIPATSSGGQEGPCGWLKDRYGLSWQVVPSAVIRAVSGSDEKKADRVMAAVMEMKKIELPKIEAAARGGA